MVSVSTLLARGERSILQSVLSGTISQFRDGQIIYSQGDTANTLCYIREGSVMLTIRSKRRRPAVVTVLGARDFFGQSCLADIPLRRCTATAIGSCSILTIRKKEMIRNLREDRVISNFFVDYLLSVLIKHQERLVDLLVNSAEQRLAGVLLELAQLSTKDGRIPKISQRVLANMVGTTRSRTSSLMNRFKKRGLVSYNGGIKVHSSLRAAYLPH